MRTRTASTQIRKQADKLKGQPVCVVLHDGRYYVGWLEGTKGDQLMISGRQGSGKAPSTGSRGKARSPKARVSSLAADGPFAGMLGGGGLASAAAGAGAAEQATTAAAGGGFLSGLGGLTGMMGFMQKALPMLQMGMNMVKTIMPLLGGLK